VDLREGLNDLGEFVFPLVVEAGSVCVRTNTTDPLLHGVLSLRSVDSLAVDRWNFLVGFGRSRLEEGDPLSFCFEQLPAGEYEVRLFAHDATGVRVDTQIARVPGPEVLFERVPTPTVELTLAVRLPKGLPEPQRSAVLSFDRRTRSFQAHGVRVGAPIASVERGDPRRWFALASGCRPLEFALDWNSERDGRLNMVVALEPGFGAVVAARDGEVLLRTPGIWHESPLRRQRAKLLADVQINANHATVARTDADGLALLSLDLAPQQLSALALLRCEADVANWRDGALNDPLAPIEFWLSWMFQ
jgi:hypothetical protein